MSAALPQPSSLKGRSRAGMPASRTLESAATLASVVDHYERALRLHLAASQKHDLIEYLKSL